MLQIPTRIGPSALHGLGVFAAQPIARGTVVWRFTPHFDLDLDPALLDALPAPQRATLLHYGYVDTRLNRYILCCDDARFLNHSENPNLGSDGSDDPHGVDIARRDIAAGEELTVDYRALEGSAPATTSG